MTLEYFTGHQPTRNYWVGVFNLYLECVNKPLAARQPASPGLGLQAVGGVHHHMSESWGGRCPAPGTFPAYLPT